MSDRLMLYYSEVKLLRNYTSHLEDFVRVTPLVVVPSANLDEGRIKLDTSLYVEDGSA